MDEWIRDLHRFLASFIVSVNSGKVSDKASERRRKKLVNDEKLPFPLHDDISRTESRIEINEKAF